MTEKFTASLIISEVPLRGAKMVVGDQEIWSLPYCQCTPDYVVTYYRKDKKLISFEINHWTHIRFRSSSHWYDEDLVPGSIGELKKEIALRFLLDDDFFKKEANQSTTAQRASRVAER